MKDLLSWLEFFIEALTTLFAFIVGVGSVILFLIIIHKERICTQNCNNNNTIETTIDSCKYKYVVIPCGKSVTVMPICKK